MVLNKNIKTKKGFTLVEVLIAVAITMMLLAAVMSLFSPISKMLNSVKSNSIADTICTNSANYVAKKVTIATTIKIAGYDSLAEMKAASSAMVNSITLGSGEKLYAMVITDADADGPNALYDLGEVDGSTIVSMLTDKASLTPYRVFEDIYYGNMDIKFGFELETTKWVNIKTTAYSQDGDKITDTRENMFRLMNKAASATAMNDSKDDLLVLYVVKTYTEADAVI